ncbi:MAG: hypothetical protein ACFE9L_16950 [Candidatus Hodarchaeota archaeon]
MSVINQQIENIDHRVGIVSEQVSHLIEMFTNLNKVTQTLMTKVQGLEKENNDVKELAKSIKTFLGHKN